MTVIYSVNRCDTRPGELSVSRTRGSPKSTVDNILENEEMLEKCR